jgi:hypothetical protein
MPYLKIQIRKLFKVEPEFTVHLIRLMAAANDFNTVASSTDRLPDPKEHAENIRIEGQRVYFFRLMCGHLHEAIQVLRDLERDSTHILQAAPSELELDSLYDTITTTVFPLEGQLARLRHHAIFHYDYSELIGAIEEWEEDAEEEILIGDNFAQTRHALADEAFSTAIKRIFGLPSLKTEEAKRAASQLFPQFIPLQIDLMKYVVGLLHTVRTIYPEMIQVVEG